MLRGRGEFCASRTETYTAHAALYSYVNSAQNPIWGTILYAPTTKMPERFTHPSYVCVGKDPSFPRRYRLKASFQPQSIPTSYAGSSSFR